MENTLANESSEEFDEEYNEDGKIVDEPLKSEQMSHIDGNLLHISAILRKL